VKNAIHVLSEFIFPPNEWSDDRTSGGQRLTHLWIHVKQIITKSIKRRKNYVLQQTQNLLVKVASTTSKNEQLLQILECPMSEIRFSGVPLFW
jgi:hypothetical protein